MINAALPKAKVTLFGLVRDENGKPKFDGDPKNAHPEILKLLTDEERAELGLTKGD